MSPYGVAAGECIAHPPPHIAERRRSRSAQAKGLARYQDSDSATVATAAAAAAATAPAQEPPQLGGRVFRLTKFAEKPTAEYARENLVTEGLGRGEGGEGRHLVVFGQASRATYPFSFWYRSTPHPYLSVYSSSPVFFLLVAERGNSPSFCPPCIPALPPSLASPPSPRRPRLPFASTSCPPGGLSTSWRRISGLTAGNGGCWVRLCC